MDIAVSPSLLISAPNKLATEIVPSITAHLSEKEGREKFYLTATSSLCSPSEVQMHSDAFRIAHVQTPDRVEDEFFLNVLLFSMIHKKQIRAIGSSTVHN